MNFREAKRIPQRGAKRIFKRRAKESKANQINMNHIRMFEAFCGYGSQALAMERLAQDHPEKVSFEVVGVSDIDKPALQAYQALHGQCPNFGDISKIDWAQVPDFDLFTYSFPCQSISMAGKREGLEEGSGTKSSLLWECERAIETKRPDYLLMENVEALTFEKNLPQLKKWLGKLDRLGYDSYTKVLEATDYGVPQMRRRVFCVSVKKGKAPYPYYFPDPSGKGDLQAIFERAVPQSYDVKPDWFERVKRKHPDNYRKLLSPAFLKAAEAGRTNAVITDYSRKNKGRPVMPSVDAVPTLRSEEESHGVPKLVFEVTNDQTVKQASKAKEDRANTLTAQEHPKLVFEISVDMSGGWTNTPASEEKAQTLLASCQPPAVYEHSPEFVRVRKLTPREGYRLMGLRDADIDKIQTYRDENGTPISESQQRKMAGNSIVVDVLYHIFRKMFVDTGCEPNGQIRFF